MENYNHPWEEIYVKKQINKHNFKKSPFYISGEDIKEISKKYSSVNHRELRIICKQDTRESRPIVFKDNNLFLLPVSNGNYCIIEGEGYINIPENNEKSIVYESKLDFDLITSKIGNSEMQHLDYAYATSILRTFMEDTNLVLTIRGRKYTPEFSFYAGKYNQKINVKSVQTEIDAGYESKDKILLVEAKNCSAKNTIIRQLYYPFKQWSVHCDKQISTVFFEKIQNDFIFWLFGFENENNYNSIKLIKSAKYIHV